VEDELQEAAVGPVELPVVDAFAPLFYLISFLLFVVVVLGRPVTQLWLLGGLLSLERLG
jgi:hypothetical protein